VFDWRAPTLLEGRLARLALPTVRYLFTIESHVYAFAMAAAALLTFFPFVVLLLSLSSAVGWRGAEAVIYAAVADLLPDDPGLSEFVLRNLRAAVEGRHGELLSLVALLFGSNSLFVPLEVALNRLWGFPADRSWLRNQAYALGLAWVGGALALGAAWLASGSGPVAPGLGQLPELLRGVAARAAAVPLSMLMLLLVYLVLPNGAVPFRRAAPAAVVAGLGLEAFRHFYVLVWPLLDFRRAYGPFFISITLLLGSYFGSMIVLAGAELAARDRRPSA
jgi:membrane protein/epoxyqueuosine reductase